MIAHPPRRGGRIRTCDLLVPNQARWPDYATPRANHLCYFNSFGTVVPKASAKVMKLFYFANIYLTNNLFVNNCGESGIILSLLHYITKHCGESGIISFAEAKSMDFVSNQGSHPFFLHYIAERAGFEPAVRLPVRQFSKLVVLATHPSLQWFKELGGKISKSFDKSKEY